MKKLIISKTLIFLFIISFVIGFEAIFTAKNTLVGVTVIIALLALLERDLTVSPWKRLFMLLGMNLSQGIFAYLASTNMWIGLPINFIAMFIVGFFWTYQLKKSLHIAFGLQYLFMLTIPVTSAELPIRLASLACGAILIMLVQLLVNKNNLSKKGPKIILLITTVLQEKIKLVQSGENYTTVDTTIYTALKNIRKIIYEKRSQNFYLTTQGQKLLNISSHLETMMMLLNEKEINKRTYTIVEKELSQLKEYLHDKEQLNVSIKKIETDLTLIPSSSVVDYKLVNSLLFMLIQIKELTTLNKKELNTFETESNIPYTFRSSVMYRANFNPNSVTFSYAFRVGFVVAFSAFICELFKISGSQWLLYTVFSITQPYLEYSKHRTLHRPIGTLIGAAVFIVSFSIFHDPTIRSFIVILAGYLNSYAVHYRDIVSTATISALGTAALIGDPSVLTWQRISCVLLGILIAILVNRFIFPHYLQKGTEEYMHMYKKTSARMMRYIYQYVKFNSNSNSINNLYAVSSLVEDRILLHNETLAQQEIDIFLKEQQVLHNEIYDVFLRIKNGHGNKQVIHNLFRDLNKVPTNSLKESQELLQTVTYYIDKTNNLNDRILLTDISKIMKKIKLTNSPI